MELDKSLAITALKSLDEKLAQVGFGSTTLIVGGGGAMILQYGYSGATVDIDAVPLDTNFENLKPFMTEVSRELKIAPDWLNPYYQAFTIYLPKDAKQRMKVAFSGKVITVKVLGAEELLIMKLMAGRSKDMGHIKHLLKMKINISVVEQRLEELLLLYEKPARKALDALDDLRDAT